MMNEQTEINLTELRSSRDDGESCAVHAFSHDHFGRAHPRLFVASLIGDVVVCGLLAIENAASIDAGR